MSDTSDVPILLSIEETMTALSLGRTTVWSLIKGGDLVAVKIGRRVLVPRDELERFVARLVEKSRA